MLFLTGIYFISYINIAIVLYFYYYASKNTYNNPKNFWSVDSKIQLILFILISVISPYIILVALIHVMAEDIKKLVKEKKIWFK